MRLMIFWLKNQDVSIDRETLSQMNEFVITTAASVVASLALRAANAISMRVCETSTRLLV